MLNQRLYTLLLLSVFGLGFSRINDDFLQKIVSKLDTYERDSFHEKVYLHLDRPYYATGETIWFKAYATFAADNSADTLSRVLYVELLRKQTQQRVLSRKIRLNGGVGQGDIFLPDTLAGGMYQIRAYTQWMRNYTDELFFRKDIQIVRPDTPPSNLLPPNADDIDVQFLPEGGQLVQNLESRIALKAIDVSGKGVEVAGFVLNQSNDTLVGFKSEHLGMGVFNFRPDAAEKYRVVVQKPNGQFVQVPFPKIEKEGFVMTVDNLSNKDNLRVFIKHNKPANATEEVALIAHNQGTVTYAAKANLSRPTSLFNIPKAKMGDGIIHLTLFDQNNRPLCERLVFVRNAQPLHISLKTDKTTYDKRQKVTVEIEAKDAEGKPVAGHFSLAATDADQIAESPFVSNIVSYLRLESDLVGPIEQPNYYFDSQQINAARHLDLLMMTQGWRRFVWSDIFKDKPSEPTFLIEQGISLTGKVLRPNGKAPDKPINLTFMLRQRDSSQVFLMGETTDKGLFAAYALDLTDSTDVLIQAMTTRGNRNLNISLDVFSPAPVTFVKVPFNPIQFDAAALQEYLRRASEYLAIERRIRESREKLLQEVVIRAKREQPDNRRTLYGRPSNTLKFDDTNSAGALTIFDVIQGRIPGVQVIGSGLDRRVQIRGAANFSGIVEPLYLLDGVPVNRDAIQNIPPFDVEAVDVLKGAEASIYGSQGAGGVIAILTKRGNPNFDFTQEKSEGTLVCKIMGYSPVREFYAPRYDVPIPEHERPDFRSTLCWTPMIKTDNEGKASVSFFTSDAKPHLRISVEGTNGMGLLGAAQLHIK
ncbi:MAG: TonB-dependent receptor plug domain-containing protein [Runella sp.]